MQKSLSLIARDENLHLAASLNIIRALIKDDKDFVKIKEETNDEVMKMFDRCIRTRRRAGVTTYLETGSMIGLNS